MKKFFGSIQKLDKKITVQINWALILFLAVVKNGRITKLAVFMKQIKN